MSNSQEGEKKETTRRSSILTEQPCRVIAAVVTGGASEVFFRLFKLSPEQQRRLIAAVATGGASEVLRGLSNLFGGRSQGR